MRWIHHLIVFSGLVLGLVSKGLAQDIPPRYIREALGNNLSLREKKIPVEKSLLALKEARSYFLPTTRFEAQHTLARGGRNIDIPVGDLLNPVYNTLNQLTGSNKFPSVKNVSEQLNPDNFYDVRLRTSLPLLNPDLKAQQQIRQKEIELEQLNYESYARELVKEVKTAYYQYLLSRDAAGIFEQAMVLVQQHLRLNQSLLRNGKGVPANIARAESEVMKVQARLQQAEADTRNAQAYFNFLLNKPLSDSIEVSTFAPTDPVQVLSGSFDNVGGREELKSLRVAGEINRQVLRMDQSFRIPRINLFLDLAAQGFDFRVKSNSFYYLGGIQLSIPVFSGHRNLYKAAQTKLDGRMIELKQAQTTQQLILAAFVSRNAVNTAKENMAAAAKELEAARSYFSLTEKSYREGVTGFIELLDARNQLTDAGLKLNITRFSLLKAQAELERQTAVFDLNFKN